VLFWMIDSQGVIGASLQRLFNDPQLSLKASPTLTWVTLFVYGIWHAAPFSFVVFYAGLQTVPGDTLESAMIDGASRWERVRFVIVPHLVPLATFIALVQLMDNFRVFEPIIGFSAAANATSLSYLIFNDLRGSDAPLFGSAAATSMLTIIGVVILLMPVLIRTWRDFNRKT
jgi:multiple sugar transport system permease protein